MIEVDVLIIGLGPAGASAAAHAAQRGARVMAIDRRRHAGLPVQCAEFVPALLGRDTAAVRASAVQDITAMETYLDGICTHTPDFRGVMIDRATFDAALVDEAALAGADLVFGTSLLGIEGGMARLSTGQHLRARVIIGADGPKSVIGRLAGLANTQLVEARQITVPLARPHSATDIFLSPEIEGGYAWLFPRGNVANLGIGVAPHAKARLKSALEALRLRLVADGRIGAGQDRLSGGAIPVGGIAGLAGSIGAIPILLAGDAAGLANPITGAGINAAVLSGQMAGDAAAKMAQGRSDAAADYAEDVTDLFAPSLSLACARRRAILATYTPRTTPSPADLRRSWIAYSDYWARETVKDDA